MWGVVGVGVVKGGCGVALRGRVEERYGSEANQGSVGASGSCCTGGEAGQGRGGTQASFLCCLPPALRPALCGGLCLTLPRVVAGGVVVTVAAVHHWGE